MQPVFTDKSAGIRLLHKKDMAGSTIYYYILTNLFKYSEDPAENNKPFYGVRLEKRDGERLENIRETAEEAGLAGQEGQALLALQKLCDLEVTPMTFFEVIDGIMDAL